jgi:hypothetical protein
MDSTFWGVAVILEISFKPKGLSFITAHPETIEEMIAVLRT